MNCPICGEFQEMEGIYCSDCGYHLGKKAEVPTQSTVRTTATQAFHRVNGLRRPVLLLIIFMMLIPTVFGIGFANRSNVTYDIAVSPDGRFVARSGIYRIGMSSPIMLEVVDQETGQLYRFEEVYSDQLQWLSNTTLNAKNGAHSHLFSFPEGLDLGESYDPEESGSYNIWNDAGNSRVSCEYDGNCEVTSFETRNSYFFQTTDRRSISWYGNQVLYMEEDRLMRVLTEPMMVVSQLLSSVDSFAITPQGKLSVYSEQSLLIYNMDGGTLVLETSYRIEELLGVWRLLWRPDGQKLLIDAEGKGAVLDLQTLDYRLFVQELSRFKGYEYEASWSSADMLLYYELNYGRSSTVHRGEMPVEEGELVMSANGHNILLGFLISIWVAFLWVLLLGTIIVVIDWLISRRDRNAVQKGELEGKKPKEGMQIETSTDWKQRWGIANIDWIQQLSGNRTTKSIGHSHQRTKVHPIIMRVGVIISFLALGYVSVPGLIITMIMTFQIVWLTLPLYLGLLGYIVYKVCQALQLPVRWYAPVVVIGFVMAMILGGFGFSS